MSDPIPSPRESAYDRLAARIGEMQDRRLREHHAIRLLHRPDRDDICVCCGEHMPCRTLAVIDAVRA